MMKMNCRRAVRCDCFPVRELEITHVLCQVSNCVNEYVHRLPLELFQNGFATHSNQHAAWRKGSIQPHGRGASRVLRHNLSDMCVSQSRSTASVMIVHRCRPLGASSCGRPNDRASISAGQDSSWKVISTSYTAASSMLPRILMSTVSVALLRGSQTSSVSDSST